MTIEAFPPHEEADQHGILAVGGDLEVESLLLSYRNGIFPWPLRRSLLAWFSPPERAVIFFEELHLSRSLLRDQKRSKFTLSRDKNFAGVIEGCARAKNRKQAGSWLYPAMVQAYIQLHNAGHAHSVECYDGDELVGGIYGVQIGRFFAAESMFYKKPNASKFAFLELIAWLEEQNITWLDCQVINPFTASLGAREIPRAQFLQLLAQVVTQ